MGVIFIYRMLLIGGNKKSRLLEQWKRQKNLRVGGNKHNQASVKSEKQSNFTSLKEILTLLFSVVAITHYKQCSWVKIKKGNNPLFYNDRIVFWKEYDPFI